MDKELKKDLEELQRLINKVGEKHDLYYMSMCRFRKGNATISFSKEDNEKIKSFE